MLIGQNSNSGHSNSGHSSRNSSTFWSETHSISVMLDLENSVVSNLEKVKSYSKKNMEIIGDVMRKEIDEERERIAKTIAENMGSDFVVNILSIRLPPLDLELEREKIKKEMKMNKKGKTLHSEKEYSIHGPEQDIQRSINDQTMGNKENQITVGPRSLEPNGEDKMKNDRPDTEKETSVPGPWDSGQNPRFESNVQADSMVNEEKHTNSFTSQQLQTTARRHSNRNVQLLKVPRSARNISARREAVCDFTSNIDYQGRTQARVIFKRFGEEFESSFRIAKATSTSNLKRFLSLKSMNL